MVKSTGAMRSPLSSTHSQSSPAVSVTRKSAYQYGNTSVDPPTDTSAAQQPLPTPGDKAPDALPNSTPTRKSVATTATLPTHFTSNSPKKRKLNSQLKLWLRVFKNQPLLNKVLWVGVLVTSFCQLMWLNPLYQTDPLSPLIAVTHAMLSIVFTTILAPYLLHVHTTWHHIYPHAHETTSLIPLNIFWACIPVLALSSIAPSITDLIYAHGAIAQAPRAVLFFCTAGGVGFVYVVRVMGKQIVIATVSDGSNTTGRKVVKRRSSNFNINNIIAPGNVGAASASSSAVSAAGGNSYSSRSLKTTNNTSFESVYNSKTWIKRLATSFESHVGVLGLIASGWSLGFLESFYNNSQSSTNSNSTSIIPIDSTAPHSSVTVSPKALLLPLVLIIFQATVSFSLIYSGAFGLGVRHLPPKTQQINLQTFNLSRQNSASSLQGITTDQEESGIPLLSQQQQRHDSGNGSFFLQQRQDSTGGSNSGFLFDSEPPSESGYTTPSVPGTPSESGHYNNNLEDLATNLADAVNNMVKKRTASNSLRNAVSREIAGKDQVKGKQSHA
ncbi:UNVERIFIED_CONTAM: hypothetical protein HDU68_009224 [Siphonaria sp. JEL0065]|nr:hypothetical protein HDU68_009224 [Siphonaria sp. JEL0065]